MLDVQGVVVVALSAVAASFAARRYELEAAFAGLKDHGSIDVWLNKLDETHQHGIIVLCACFWGASRELP